MLACLDGEALAGDSKLERRHFLHDDGPMRTETNSYHNGISIIAATLLPSFPKDLEIRIVPFSKVSGETGVHIKIFTYAGRDADNSFTIYY